MLLPGRGEGKKVEGVGWVAGLDGGGWGGSHGETGSDEAGVTVMGFVSGWEWM